MDQGRRTDRRGTHEEGQVSDPTLHILLNRINELTLKVETVRAMCEKRIAEVSIFSMPADLNAYDILAVLNTDPDDPRCPGCGDVCTDEFRCVCCGRRR